MTEALSSTGRELHARWQQRLGDEADTTVAAALRVLDREPDPLIIPVLVALVLGSARRQSASAERFLLDLLLAEIGETRPAWGLDTTPNPDRIEAAFETALAREVPAARSSVGRITHHESTTAGRAALGVAMARTPQIRGWTRSTDADPCKLCASLVGPVLPTDTQMITHPGCACTQLPVLQGDTT